MFFVECKADLTLVRALSNAPPNKIMHAGNKSGVLGKLIRARGRPNYQNSIGMVDQDPWSSQSSSLKRFKEMECCNDLGIKVLHYRWLNNHVVVLCPRLEEWIVEASNEAGMDLANYGLPADADTLHEVINLDTEKFENFLAELKIKSRRVKGLVDRIHRFQHRNPAMQ